MFSYYKPCWLVDVRFNVKPPGAYPSLGILTFREITDSSHTFKCKREFPCSLYINLCSLQMFGTSLATTNKLNWYCNMPIFSYSHWRWISGQANTYLQLKKWVKAKLRKEPPLSTCDMNRDYFSIMKTEKPKFEIILEVKLPLFYRQPHHPRLLLLPPTSSTNLHLVSFLSIFSNAPLS